MEGNMDSSADVPNTILTAAESFPSGEAVELLANGQLLLSTPGGEPVIGSSVSWANNRYGPVPLDPSLQQVLRLPDHIEAFGTTEELVRDLVRFLGCSDASWCSSGCKVVSPVSGTCPVA